MLVSSFVSSFIISIQTFNGKFKLLIINMNSGQFETEKTASLHNLI